MTRHRPLMSWRLSALIVFGAWKIAGRVPIRSAVPTFLAAIAALIPILVLVYGIGLTFKVFVVGIMAMPVIVRNTGPAVRKTPAARNAMATSFLARDRDVLLTIIPPAASPGIFPGLRRGDPVGP